MRRKPKPKPEPIECEMLDSFEVMERGVGLQIEGDDAPFACAGCGCGSFDPMGTLGGLNWFRCRRCGWESSRDAG